MHPYNRKGRDTLFAVLSTKLKIKKLQQDGHWLWYSVQSEIPDKRRAIACQESQLLLECNEWKFSLPEKCINTIAFIQVFLLPRMRGRIRL